MSSKVFSFSSACLGAAKVFIIASYGLQRSRGPGVTRGGRRPGVTLLMVRDRQYIDQGQAVISWCVHPCNPIVKVIITFHVFTQFYRYIEDLCCLVNILDTGHI